MEQDPTGGFNPANYLGVSLGTDVATPRSLRGDLGRFIARDALNLAAYRVSLHRLAERLEAKLREEFIRGGHDRSGNTDLPGDHVHSVDTLRVEDRGTYYDVLMFGGAPFVQSGWQAHLIEPRNATRLHWTEGGDDHFAMMVENPGYAGDDFVGRALAGVDVDMALRRLGLGLFSEWHSYSENWRGEQYFPGQAEFQGAPGL